MNYYRVQVQLGHLGSARAQFEEWHIATSSSATDVMFNTGKLLPGINRVLEVHAVTEQEWRTMRELGRQAFTVEPRR